jgi:hypothetical protein
MLIQIHEVPSCDGYVRRVLMKCDDRAVSSPCIFWINIIVAAGYVDDCVLTIVLMFYLETRVCPF